MSSEKKYNEIVSTLKKVSPVLTDQNEVTDLILKTIKQGRSIKPLNRMIRFARPVLGAAALWLTGFFIVEFAGLNADIPRGTEKKPDQMVISKVNNKVPEKNLKEKIIEAHPECIEKMNKPLPQLSRECLSVIISEYRELKNEERNGGIQAFVKEQF